MKISLKADLESVSSVKPRIPEVFEQAAKNGRPKIVTQNGAAIGVMIDMDSYEFIIKKVNLLKLINEGEESLRTSPIIKLADVKKSIKSRYGF